MTQAVEDGATRPVYYESRVIKLHLDENIIRLIDTEYDLMANSADEEVIQKSHYHKFNSFFIILHCIYYNRIASKG